MVTVAPESAASMHGPNPASYWRSSSWADSGPVKATLKTCPSFIRVTETSAAPVIVCLASSATRPRVSDSCCSLSMILLSSAKATRGSIGGSAPPVWGVDMVAPAVGRTAGSGLATVLETAPSAAHERRAGTRTGGRTAASTGSRSSERRQLAACVGPTARGRRYSPIACPGRTSTAATAPTAASARLPQPGAGPPEPGDSGRCRYAFGNGGAVGGLGRAEAGQFLPPADSVPDRGAPTVLDAGTTAKELRCPHPPPSPASSPSWLGGWPT